MAYKIRFRMEALRSAAFGTIGAAYSAVGASISQPVRAFKITNNTDKAVLISLDGTTDNMFLPAMSFTLYDLTANKVRDDGFFMELGTFFWVKQSTAGAPTSGSLDIETIYAG